MRICPYCGANLRQRKMGLNYAGVQRYQCMLCGRRYSPGSKLRAKPGSNPPIEKPCAICGRPTTNPKFCSRSCSATHSNFVAPKRTRQPRYCKYCGTPVENRSRVCDACNPNNVDWSTRTIGEIQASAKYQISAALRTVARQVYRQSTLPRVCRNCGYDKHVEICHIRAIGTFPDDTPVSVVSGIENLVALCPNCHWEFDNGLLTIESLLSTSIRQKPI